MLRGINRGLFFGGFLVLLSYSCKKDPKLFNTENLNNNSISVFGHAGMGIGFKYPIDTYESIEPCLRIGAQGTELDVQLTKDSVLIVYHHQTLKDGTLCDGRVNDKNWNDIKTCNLASPLSSNINLLTFDELMKRLRDDNFDLKKYTFTFDCKLYTNQTNAELFHKQFARTLLKAISKNNLETNSFIESTDTSFIRILKKSDPTLKLFIYPSSFEQGLDIAKRMNLFGISTHNEHITAEQIKQAHENNLRITLWGINTDEDNLDAIYKSPDYIQTDRIIHLLKIFELYKE